MNVRSVLGYQITRDQDGWWAILFVNFRGEAVAGPYKAARAAKYVGILMQTNFETKGTAHG